jgi:hypothetical protein
MTMTMTATSSSIWPKARRKLLELIVRLELEELVCFQLSCIWWISYSNLTAWESSYELSLLCRMFALIYMMLCPIAYLIDVLLCNRNDVTIFWAGSITCWQMPEISLPADSLIAQIKLQSQSCVEFSIFNSICNLKVCRDSASPCMRCTWRIRHKSYQRNSWSIWQRKNHLPALQCPCSQDIGPSRANLNAKSIIMLSKTC